MIKKRWYPEVGHCLSTAYQLPARRIPVTYLEVRGWLQVIQAAGSWWVEEE